jgi:hypothetical protein
MRVETPALRHSARAGGAILLAWQRGHNRTLKPADDACCRSACQQADAAMASTPYAWRAAWAYSVTPCCLAILIIMAVK